MTNKWANISMTTGVSAVGPVFSGRLLFSSGFSSRLSALANNIHTCVVSTTIVRGSRFGPPSVAPHRSSTYSCRSRTIRPPRYTLCEAKVRDGRFCSHFDGGDNRNSWTNALLSCLVVLFAATPRERDIAVLEGEGICTEHNARRTSTRCAETAHACTNNRFRKCCCFSRSSITSREIVLCAHRWLGLHG